MTRMWTDVDVRTSEGFGFAQHDKFSTAMLSFRAKSRNLFLLPLDLLEWYDSVVIAKGNECVLCKENGNFLSLKEINVKKMKFFIHHRLSL